MAQPDTTVQLSEVVVTASGKSVLQTGLRNQVFDSSSLASRPASTLADVLGNTSVYLKSYGPGNLSTPVLRGGSYYHTALLWNGIPVASPLNGANDLSLINGFLFDEAVLQYGSNPVLHGSGAVSGSIQLNNKPSFQSGLKASVGIFSDGLENNTQAVKAEYGTSRYYGSLKIVSTIDRNEYYYSDMQTNKRIKEENARVVRQTVKSDNFYRSGNWLFYLGAWLSKSERQFPPAPFGSDIESNQDDAYRRIAGEVKFGKGSNDVIFRSAYLFEQIEYDNAFLSNPSDNTCHTLVNELQWIHRFSKNHQLISGVINNYSKAGNTTDLLNSDSSGNPGESDISMDRMSFYMLYRYLSTNARFKASAGARKEISNLNNSPDLFSSGIEYVLAKGINSRLAASGLFRTPTLNDLYWNPGGNPDLLDEKGYSVETGLNIQTRDLFSREKKWDLAFDVTGWYKWVDNWIIWYPTNGSIWSPLNLLAVESRGIELSATASYRHQSFACKISFDYSRTISTNERTVLENDASLHKQLIYVPQNRWVSQLEIKYEKTGIRLTEAYTGYRYTSSDNADYIEPFYLADAEVFHGCSIKSIDLQAYLSVKNIFDTDYQLVVNRPMPLRYWQAGVIISYSKKKSS